MPTSSRSYTARHFKMNLAGVDASFVSSLEGGHITSDVIVGPTEKGVRRKQPGTTRIEPITVEWDLATDQAVYDWIAQSWQNVGQPKDVAIVEFDDAYKVKGERQFHGARILETTLPAADASSKERGTLTVKFQPESLELITSSQTIPSETGPKPKQTAWLQRNFRLDIAGLDCTQVFRIDSFTIKQSVAEASTEFPNLTITLPENAAQTWVDWHKHFLINGDGGDERSGSLTFLSPNALTPLGRINFFNLGIFKIAPEPYAANSDKMRYVTAELYCERMELQYGDVTTSSIDSSETRIKGRVRSVQFAPTRRGTDTIADSVATSISGAAANGKAASAPSDGGSAAGGAGSASAGAVAGTATGGAAGGAVAAASGGAAAAASGGAASGGAAGAAQSGAAGAAGGAAAGAAAGADPLPPAATLPNPFHVQGDMRVDGKLSVNRDTRFNSKLDVGAELRVGSTLKVAANTSVGGSLDVGAHTTVKGNLVVLGSVIKSSGSFRIDHPQDPLNQYLYHSFVESPDMLNVYNGTGTLDDRGEAWITLPDWFEMLNRDFRYQLTAIGAPAPNLHISREIAGNRFQISGGVPGTKVSWQVTGVRQDPIAEAHRIPVAEDKPLHERGGHVRSIHANARSRAPAV